MPAGRAERYAQSRVVVIAHHSEDPAWTAGVTAPGVEVVLYTDSGLFAGRPGFKLYPAGKGKEARAYLSAIVDRWDALPDAMVFLHAHNTSWHTVVGHGNNLGSVWRLNHLKWPISEYFVPLSVGGCVGCVCRCMDDEPLAG